MDTHLVRLLLTASALTFTACRDARGPTGPSTEGAVRVLVTTTGADLDPDGYSINVDSALGEAVAVNGVVVFPRLTIGAHSVHLGDMAANCSPSGSNPRSFEVIPRDTVHLAFDVGCTAVYGSVSIVTTTTGVELDPDGYRVSVDGAPAIAVGVNSAVVVSGLNAGTHSGLLSGIAGNCAPSGVNPRSFDVIARDTVQLAFAVSCGAMGGVFGQIAFTSVVCDFNGCGSQRIVIMNADGLHLTPLTAPGSFDGAAWSPDGMKIAFDDDRYIYVMDADGSNQIRLTNTLAREPAWSPDGSKIVFLGSGVCVMDADGSNHTCITSGGAQAAVALRSGPTWSPDGSQIAFSDYVGNRSEIFVINADGSNRRQVTNGLGIDDAIQPAWSPDGTRIAFSSNHGGYRQIYLVRPDGSDVVAIGNPNVCAYQPAWSSDGMRIAFTTCGSEDLPGLWILWMNADGTGSLGPGFPVNGMNSAWRP